ncbi:MULTISPECIES: mechanosensitive ion channel family protein [Marinobacter]|uniref:mechanosensitive ion channel family protein n=1 Tax=Marinobacter TaxID=2742 RepID=UPI000DAD1CB0|nr:MULTISPECIES: mechanosensitive ion channel family protein [Marinobacter]
MDDIGGALAAELGSIDWGAWLRVVVLLALGFVLATAASRGMARLLGSRSSRHVTVLFGRVVFYAIFVIFIIAALREAGFAPDVLLGAAGILTVAIGFASQTSASNMISGLFLLVEKPFEIGNFIEVDGTIGEVIGIDMLSVKLRTADNLYVRIPNETLIKTRVINRSRFPIRRLDLTVGIAYREDIRRVQQLLLSLAEESTVCLEEPKPFVLTTAFGPSSVDLQFSFWVPADKVLEGRSTMMEAVKALLDREQVEIPFPHTSVYAGSASQPFRIELIRDDNRQEVTDDER